MTATALKRRKIELEVNEGWSAYIFLALALLLVAWSLSEAGYGEGLDTVILVTLGAIVASLFLAKSRLPWFLAHLFSLVYGVSWIGFLLSYELPETFSARERLLELGYRIGDWFRQTVLGGELGTDELMFVVVMSILFWLMAYLAIWFSFRAHSMWAALLPSGITLMINVYYGPERIALLLVPYLLFAMLFAVRLNLYLQEQSWRNRRIRYDIDIVYSFLRYGATIAILALALAWIAPAAAGSEQAEILYSRIGEPWERVKDEWIRLFSTLQSERTQPGTPSFGMTLALGGPVNLSNATLMDVRARGGRYWRAATYDQYTGQGWMTTERESQFLEAGAVLTRSIPYEARRIITQTYTIYTPNATQLFALNQAERFSLPIKASVLEVEGEDGTPQIASLSMASSRYSLNSGDSYMVISSIPSAEENAMRLAGDDYPDWIDHYLQLPDTVPQRVHDLALEITAEYDNAYDKAMALQDYAREFTYNDQIEAPPPNVDPVDYFLFDLQEGYCNYYASAMAVMARSVGIPARIAAGYTQGDWERDAQAYRVRQHHSHAWVEVFFPRFGWVEFEPTASEPVIVRPRVAGGGSDDNRAGNQEGFGGPEDYLDEDRYGPDSGVLDPEALERLLEQQRRRAQIRTWTRVGIVLGVSVLVIVIAWFLGRREMDQTRPAAVYYERMIRRGTRAGYPIVPTQTPNEYARQLSGAIQNEEAGHLVHRIANAYVGERYGHKNPARYQPDFAWRDLRTILFRWGVAHRWKRLWGRA